MAVDIPSSMADVTPEWLTAALQEGGAVRGAEITAMELEPIGVGVGLLGDLARAQPRYHGDHPAAPASVIVKLPAAEGTQNRATGMAFGFYEREIRFYREIAPKLSLRVPACWWSGMDVAAGRFALVLEDLSDLQMADQVAGVSVERATMAVERLARFHADWWETDALDALDWMPLSNGPVTVQAVGLYERDWPPFVERFGGRLSPEAVALGERVRDRFASLLDGLGQSPRTIVHTDFRLDNLFFGPEEVAIIDWQLSTRGRGVYDVAYLLSQSMTVDDRRASEEAILRRWHDTLTEAGVTGYSWDQALEDYTRCLMICLVIPVAAGGRLDLGNERGRALVQETTDRAFAAVLDRDAGRYLPD